MAGRALQIIPRILGGGAVIIALLTLSFGTLLAVILRAETNSGLAPADWATIKFTLSQATLSALISTLFAIPTARALARRTFPGRKILVTLLGAPFILPVIVGVLGLLAVFGRAGWISQGLGMFGIDPISIYGAAGIILAHVFFNLPLATRLILHGWLSIPAERMRTANSLGFGPIAMFRYVEWPMLRGVIPGAFVVIFLLCLTSFSVALAVGGGPRATTIELAIYQAFRFDFDLGRAALLAIIQFGLCTCVAALAFLIPMPDTRSAGLDGVLLWFTRPWVRLFDTFWIGAAALFLILPLLAIAMRGAPHLLALPNQVFSAAWTSIWVALLSTFVCLVMALTLVISVARTRRSAKHLTEATGIMGLATSPLVVGTGLFLIIFPFAHPMDLALPITALVNAMMALPFAMRVLLPAVGDVYLTYLNLRDSLNMGRWPWLTLVILPRIRRPLGFSAGLAAALSMGDLGVIALFADPDVETLPLLLFRLMGAYRLDQAAAVALVLVSLSLGLFWLFDRGGRMNA
ncbi:MAG: thiamine/thiamine pyrophosphate ABC transporter permease ThiP [Planktomarina sp.]